MSAVDEIDLEVEFRAPYPQFLEDRTPERDIEGALSSGKTTACLFDEWRHLVDCPGIVSYIGRYSDGDVSSKLAPAFESLCQKFGTPLTWHADEQYYELDNKSRCYAYGLKSADHLSRYAKLRGMGVHRLYVDQAEELPADFPSELRARLRLPGWPHQLTFSPNPVDVNHWLAKEFPEEGGIPGRILYQVSLYDNAHNLPLETVEGLERAYPAGHAKHRTMILGKRGLNVIGDPIYGGLFERHRHVRGLAYDPFRPLLEAFDFGKHHPCWVVGQYQAHGGLHALGGIQGQDLFLEEFLPIVEQHRAEWFPKISERLTCCDPAGSHESSQGVRQNAVGILRDHKYLARWKDNSNAPDVRLAMIEKIGAYMLRRTTQGEMFGIEADPTHWLRASRQKIVPWGFLADGCEAGAVWDQHMVSVGSKQIRRLRNDGEYEHGQVCLTYLELNFGPSKPTEDEERKAARKRAGREWLPVSPHWSG